MKNKIRAIIAAAAVVFAAVVCVFIYLNSDSCQGGQCGPEDAVASITYSVCVSGDSIAAGLGDAAGGWASRLMDYLMGKYPGSSVGNYSLSGATMGVVKDNYDSSCGSQSADISILAAGINDSSHSVPLEVFNKNLTALYEKAKAASPKVILVGLTDVDEERLNGLNYRNESIAAYDDVIMAFAQERGVEYVQMRGLLDRTDLSDDGVHPNEKGHEKMFQKIVEKIESQATPPAAREGKK